MSPSRVVQPLVVREASLVQLWLRVLDVSCVIRYVYESYLSTRPTGSVPDGLQRPLTRRTGRHALGVTSSENLKSFDL